MPFVIAAAAALLCAVIGLLAFLLLRRPGAAALPPGRTREDLAREARDHLAKAVEHFEKKADVSWLAKANHHLISALKLGLNDGEPAERLAINLEKHGQPRHAMEVCELVLNPSYRLRKGASLTKQDFAARLARYRERYKDPPKGMPLFAPEEAVEILRASRLF